MGNAYCVKIFLYLSFLTVYMIKRYIKMSLVGCSHLQSYKKANKNRNNFKLIHAVFVVSSTPKSLKTKVCKMLQYVSYTQNCFFFSWVMAVVASATNEARFCMYAWNALFSVVINIYENMPKVRNIPCLWI